MNTKVEVKALKTQLRKERKRLLDVDLQKQVNTSSNRVQNHGADAAPSHHGAHQSTPTKTAPGLLIKRTQNPVLVPSLSTNWTDSAICRFFNDYVIEPDVEHVDTCPGFLSNLPGLFVEGEKSLLAPAITAVSLASVSNQARSPDLLLKARQSYGTALPLVRKALLDVSEATSDNTLAGILCLSMYEV